MANSKMAD